MIKLIKGGQSTIFFIFQRDDGVPLMTSSAGKNVIMGINHVYVTWSAGPCVYGDPMVFLRIDEHIEWIEKSMSMGTDAGDSRCPSISAAANYSTLSLYFCLMNIFSILVVWMM